MNPPKMPIHIGDYKRDTGHLYAAEHGAYLLLLFHHWSTGSLPNDDRQLASIACMTASEWKRTKPILVPFFAENWIHGRVIDDLAKAKVSYDKRAAAGKEGGNAKAKLKQCSSNATAMPKLPLTTYQSDRIGSAGAFTEGSKKLADSFWSALGFESPLQIPPQFSGVDWRAIGWEDAGWTADLIYTEARRIGPDKPLTYYEKVFATAFAKRQAPLPVVEIREAEKLTVKAHAKPKNGIIEAADDLYRKLASFDGPAGTVDELRGGAGEDTVRLLSNG